MTTPMPTTKSGPSGTMPLFPRRLRKCSTALFEGLCLGSLGVRRCGILNILDFPGFVPPDGACGDGAELGAGNGEEAPRMRPVVDAKERREDIVKGMWAERNGRCAGRECGPRVALMQPTPPLIKEGAARPASMHENAIYRVRTRTTPRVDSMSFPVA